MNYEFECLKCESFYLFTLTVDQFIEMYRNRGPKCPKCKDEYLKRVWTPPIIHGETSVKIQEQK